MNFLLVDSKYFGRDYFNEQVYCMFSHFSCKNLEAHLFSIVMVLVVIYHDHLYVHCFTLCKYYHIYGYVSEYYCTILYLQNMNISNTPNQRNPILILPWDRGTLTRPRSKNSAKLSNSCILHLPILQQVAKKTNGASGRNLGGMCLPGRRREFCVGQ